MNITDETLKLIQAEVAKAWTQNGTATSGLTFYDLELGAKILYPVLTPLRNRIPRVSGKGGIQANWRAITGINTTGISAGVSQGNRGGVIATTTADFIASYKGLGHEDYVNFEAQYAGQGFDDIRARATQGLLRALMISEEKVILGSNTSVALGTTPTPSVAAVVGGGSLSNAAYNVYCMALTADGFANSSVAAGVPLAISRTNADGSTDSFGGGCAQISAAASVTPAANGTIQASVAPVRGAVAYAWFWGTGGGANEKLGAITTINSVLITATATGTQLAGATGTGSDNSRNALVFDGLLYQVFNSTSNAYYKALATGTVGTGTPLTADGAGGIVEIDVALQYFWDNFRLSPTDIYVASQEQSNINKKVLAGTSTSAQQFIFSRSQGELAGGTMVRSYLNKFAMDGAKEIPIRLHPNMPNGTIMFFTDVLPYALSNVSNVVQILTRQEYYQIDWPLVKRRWEYGDYVDEVLQNYAPFAFGAITNIANG